MANKKALIVGMYGQDGSYMADLLKTKGYDVYPCTRQDNPHDLIDNIRPNEVYNFASTSNVFDPWSNLDEVFKTDALLPVKIMESILKIDKSIKFFQASSRLIFGDITGSKNEESPLSPIHPYGCAKAYADTMVKEFRRVHGLFACSGIFFNHESPRRGNDFFSKKICRAAVKGKKIEVGNLYSFRDIGYAPDFMEAVYLMMQCDYATDYVIGTGVFISTGDFAKKAFDYVGLDYNNYLYTSSLLYRGSDTGLVNADISKIITNTGWRPKHNIDDIIKIMIEAELLLL